jgi:hypothetical protein
MTSAKSLRSRRGRSQKGQKRQNDDLEVLDPESPFRKKVEELRRMVAAYGPLEEWSDAQRAEFRRRGEGDPFAIALAFAAPGLTTATSEDPHRVFDHNA